MVYVLGHLNEIELDDGDTGEQENKECVAFQVKQLVIHMDLL